MYRIQMYKVEMHNEIIFFSEKTNESSSSKVVTLVLNYPGPYPYLLHGR